MRSALRSSATSRSTAPSLAGPRRPLRRRGSRLPRRQRIPHSRWPRRPTKPVPLLLGRKDPPAVQRSNRPHQARPPRSRPEPVSTSRRRPQRLASPPALRLRRLRPRLSSTPIREPKRTSSRTGRGCWHSCSQAERRSGISVASVAEVTPLPVPAGTPRRSDSALRNRVRRLQLRRAPRQLRRAPRQFRRPSRGLRSLPRSRRRLRQPLSASFRRASALGSTSISSRSRP